MKIRNLKIDMKFVVILSLFTAAFLVRSTNFSQRVTFGPEQAISLLSAADNLHKPSLLGIPYLIRVTDTGHSLFTAPVFGYSLIPFLFLFNFQILPVTFFFLLLNWCTGILIFAVSRKIFGFTAAVIASFLFLFNNYMIYHSLFIWTSDYLPLFGILIFLLLYKIRSGRRILDVFLLGIINGLAFGIQYFYLFTGAAIFIYLLVITKRKFKCALFFIFGSVIGELPTVVFDLKHGFYHVRTLYEYFLNSLSNPAKGQISYYHFLHFWPVLCIISAYFLNKYLGKQKLLLIVILLVYLFFNLNSAIVAFNRPTGMPADLTVGNIYQAAQVISNDSPQGPFNVASLIDFDSRAHILRYPLQYRFSLTPQGVESYNNIPVLYVLASKDYNFTEAIAYEVNVFRPFSVQSLAGIGNNYEIYRLKHE